MTNGVKLLAAARAIVPSVAALRRNGVPDYAELFRQLQRDPLLDDVFAQVAAAASPHRHQQRAVTELSFVLTSQAIGIVDLTPEALLHFAWEHRATGTGQDSQRFGGVLVWDVLTRMGRFPPGTPVTLRAALRAGRRDVPALVERHGVRNPRVRQLLIDYISHRQVQGMDYPTVTALTTTLVRNFWCVVERINPGQADLQLSEDTYQAWRRARGDPDPGRTAAAPGHLPGAGPGPRPIPRPAELGGGGAGTLGPMGRPLPRPAGQRPPLQPGPSPAARAHRRPHPPTSADPPAAGRARDPAVGAPPGPAGCDRPDAAGR
jgi:hypothetical protein